MNHHDRHPRLTERDLTAFADGSLPATRCVRVEGALAASPELQASITAQRRALIAIAHTDERAPTALRARLALAHPARRAHLPRRAARACGSAAVALATIAAVAVLMLGSGGAGGRPDVAEAAMLATRAPLAPAPTHRGDSALLHGLRAGGLPYPYWEDRFGFKAVGIRRDRIAGRSATTVFYNRARQRIAYTITSGPPLAIDMATRTTHRGGSRLRNFTDHGRLVVTWLRRGHTCVLSGPGVPLHVLLDLAAWRSAGRIPN